MLIVNLIVKYFFSIINFQNTQPLNNLKKNKKGFNFQMKKCLVIWKNDYLMQNFFRTSPHCIKLFQITCGCRCRSCGSRFLCSGSGWFLCSGSGWFLCSGSGWFLCSGSCWFLCSGSGWFLRSDGCGLGRGRFMRASGTQFLCGGRLTIHFIVRSRNPNQYKATQKFDPNHVSKSF